MPQSDKPCRVAIVDDHPEIRRLLSMMLRFEPGIELVGEATNGLEAVDLARRLLPDALLLDIAMPVMDGLEALPQILAISPDTTVLMLSAFSSDQFRSEAERLGASGYVEKGSAMMQIAATLRTACAARSTPAEEGTLT